jgi:squalene synthase HpnC
VGSAGGVEVPGADRDGSGPTGADLRDGAYLRVRERAENFPVALRVLPRRLRTHLGAVYDVARVVDDLGDAVPGDRTAQLEAFSADLATIWADGTPRAPVLRRLAGTVHACDLPREPFDRLVRANLVDQRVTRYPTFADLLGYCELSAEPVGRIVLAVFGASTPRRVAWSDRICTALQLIEHWQDVAEDRRAGRIYLPVEDLDRFGVREGDLDAPADRAAARSVPALRELIAFEAGRAREMLVSGLPLLGELRGWARLAITGYAAGGLAAVDGLRRAGWEVLPGSPGVRRSDLVRRITWLLTLRRAAS